MVAPTGILSVVALLTNNCDGKGQKGSDCRAKTLGQCYLGGAVYIRAILAVTPTGILLVVALLTNKYKCKSQKGLGLQGQKPLGQWVKAILGVLFITGPSWR